MERRGIDELIGNESLRSQDVEKVTPYLQVRTSIVQHCVEWRRECKWEEICVK
jgi:hypothetical protein